MLGYRNLEGLGKAHFFINWYCVVCNNIRLRLGYCYIWFPTQAVYQPTIGRWEELGLYNLYIINCIYNFNMKLSLFRNYCTDRLYIRWLARKCYCTCHSSYAGYVSSIPGITNNSKHTLNSLYKTSQK